MRQKLSFLLLASALAGSAIAADFSQTLVDYRYGREFTEPAHPNDIAKHIFTLTHVRDGAYGKHLLALESRVSDRNDLARDGSGAHEYLLTYRWQLTKAHATGTAAAFGPVRDLALVAGIDLTTKDTLFDPRKQAWLLGPAIKFDVPGFLDLALLYYREDNHKGIPGTPHPDISFDGTWLLNASWRIPLRLAATGAVFQGLWLRVGEKGTDFNDLPTAGETLLRSNLLFDVGPAFNVGKGQLLAGVGYEWWKNKFGTPAGIGTHTRTPTVNLELVF